jgi:nucleoside 2-deoxyribosyltransferase
MFWTWSHCGLKEVKQKDNGWAVGLGNKVFLSGPIQGMEENQSYRDVMRDICLRCGYEPIDPWLREKVMYKGAGPRWWKDVPISDFIRRDLEDIRKCEVLIAFLPTLSAGTCMELFYAKLKGKITITVCEIENPSPWIVAHSDVILNRIEDLENALKGDLTPKKFSEETL